MRFHSTEVPLALVVGPLVAAGVVAGAAWGQPSRHPVLWPDTPPWAFDSVPGAGATRGERDTTRDIGDRHGGLPSCRPVYTREARPLGAGPGERDYGFVLDRVECPRSG